MASIAATAERKIILQVYGGSPKKKGSLEEYFLHLSTRLYQEGFQCIFVFDREIEANLKHYYAEAHAKILVMPETDKRFDIGMIMQFRRLFRALRPALINFHFGRACPNGLVAAWLAGIDATVWTKHSFYEDGPFYKKVSPLRKVASMIFLQAHLAKKIIAVSDGLKKELLHYYLAESKIARIYLGINLERFGAPSSPTTYLQDLGIRAGEQVISCISQARPEKGLEYLVKAVARVAETRRDFKILIVGGGPLTDTLKALADELSIREFIRFCGVRNDVERIIAISDFTVLPSLTEGLPLALLESIASGRPVIASNVGGIPEVVTDGQNGFLIPPKDAEALADKMLALLSNPDLLRDMGQACVKRATDFDVNSGVTNTIRVYEEVMQNC
jgi:glycosyltransferase involved in cell wall biosynthesis